MCDQPTIISPVCLKLWKGMCEQSTLTSPVCGQSSKESCAWPTIANPLIMCNQWNTGNR